MNPIKQNTWMLVADGAQARLFRLGQGSGEIEELQQIKSPTMHAFSRELVSDASPRSHHVAGVPGGHTKEPRTDAHDLAEQRFIQDVMKRVMRAARRGDFEALVIVADPRALGLLRKCMPDDVARRVVKQVNADLTRLPGREIDQRVRRELALH